MRYPIPPQKEFDEWNAMVARDKTGDFLGRYAASVKMIYPLTFEDIVGFVRSYKKDGIARPLRLEVYPMDPCNLDCSMCISRYFGQKHGYARDTVMSKAELERIVDLSDEMGVRLITLSGGGEPLLHPDIERTLEKIADSRMNLMVYTNGTSMTDNIVDYLIGSDAIINISLNAGSEEEYARMMGRDKYWDVIGGIRRLRSRSDGFKGVLGVSYVVVPENIAGMFDAARLISDLGASYLTFKPVSEGMVRFDPEYLRKIEDQLISIRGIKTDTRININFKPDSEPVTQNRGNPEGEYCFQGLISATVNPLGDIYPCCRQTSKRQMCVPNLRDSIGHFSSPRYLNSTRIGKGPQLHEGCFYKSFNSLLGWMYQMMEEDIVFTREKC